MIISVVECMERRLLRVVFQPIVALASGKILGYEALTRGPIGSYLESPQALFEQAGHEDCLVTLEHFVARLSVSLFAKTRVLGKLFLNLSAAAVVQIARDRDAIRVFMGETQFSADRIVIELTEQASPHSLSALQDALHLMREAGVQLALDDYGTGNTNIGRWIALQPDFIKIDRSIVDGVSRSTFLRKVLHSMCEVAEAGHVHLIAEGIEDIEDLKVCRDIGITYAQGFILGEPSEVPQLTLPFRALGAIHARAC